MKEDGQRIEVLEPCSLDETHQDLVVFDALVGAIAKSNLSQNDIVAQQTLRKVVMGTDAGTSRQVTNCRHMAESFVVNLSARG